MTKEEYLLEKQNNTISINSAYEFYCNVESTRNKISFSEFSQYFPIWLSQGNTLVKYHKYMDSKFNILSLTDNNGNIKYF